MIWWRLVAASPDGFGALEAKEEEEEERIVIGRPRKEIMPNDLSPARACIWQISFEKSQL